MMDTYREKYHFRQLGAKLEVLKEHDGLPVLVPDAFAQLSNFQMEDGGDIKHVDSKPENISLSKEDIDTIKNDAYQLGFAEGVIKGAQEVSSQHQQQLWEQNNQILDLITRINQAVVDFISEANIQLNSRLSELSMLVMVVSERLSNTMIEGKEKEILLQEIRKCLQLVVEEPGLKIGVHPDWVPFLKESRIELVSVSSPRIDAIYGDSEIGIKDFRIEWSGGSVDYQSERTRESIHHLLSSYVKNEV